MTHSHNITTTSPPVAQDATASFSSLHTDVIQNHILTRLDGISLASIGCTSTSLHHLSSEDELWSDICHATWPSTSNPSIDHIISTFPNGGPRGFFSDSYPLPTLATSSSNLKHTSSPSELISAVDIQYKNELLFTKVQETETLSGWFRCSPFRIDLLEPKDVIPTTIKFQHEDDTCIALMKNMSLSWITIDPNQRLAVNLSSHKPVSVQRHWLTGEVHARFASIQNGPSSGHVQFGIVVTCGWSEGGEMQIKEVSMEVEDMDGLHLNGKDSLVILQRALGGKKGRNGINRVEESRKRYEDYLKMKQQRKENKLKTEGVLDIASVAFGIIVVLAFSCFLLF